MTLDELASLVEDLISDHGGDSEILIYNPLTDDMEEIDISGVEEFDHDDTFTGDFFVLHSVDTILDSDDEDEEDGVED